MSLQAMVERQPLQWGPHDPHPKQSAFLALGCREALYGGAAGGGKSDALLMGALLYANTPGAATLLLRRTHRDLALPGALMDRAREWLANTPARWVDIDKTWHFPSGATMTFGYLEGPRDHERYQSAEFQFVGFDELAQFEERQYRYLFSRLRRLRGSSVPVLMRAATNPGGVGHEWIQRRWGIPEEIDFSRSYEHESRVFLPAKLEDNPSVDQGEYDAALRELDSITYQQLRHGRWVRDPSGLVYSGLDPARNVVDELPMLPDGEEWTYIIAWDFGVTDATAYAVWAYTGYDPCAYLVASQQWRGLAPSDAAEQHQALVERYGWFERSVGDIGGLGKAFAQEMITRWSIPIEQAQKGDKLGFIKLFNGEAERSLIQVVGPSNEEYLRDTLALPWKDETCTREHPTAPNHLPDAGLYGWRECRSWQSSQRPRRPPPIGSVEARAREMAGRKDALLEKLRPENQEWDMLGEEPEEYDAWTE